jgi:hypothetical protein
VRPARTNREILEALDDEGRAIVGPPLITFEGAFFGGAAQLDGVRAFLEAVDEAARALGGSS